MEATLTFSNDLIDVNDNTTFLCEKLNEAFRQENSVIKTEFVPEQNVFQEHFKSFANEQELKDSKFKNFATRSMNRIKDLMQAEIFASGGYFVFAEYIYLQRRYVGVFIVRDSEQLIFNRNNDSFDVDTTTVVNTDKLAMAVRVDVNRLIDRQGRYLQFTHRQTDHSGYFVNWIEASLSAKSNEDSHALLAILNSLNQFPEDPETNEPYESEKFRSKVFDHIQSAGKVVRLSELSVTFWNDQNFLSDYAEENQIIINDKFQAVQSILRTLKKYDLKDGKIKLSFSRADYDNGLIEIGEGDTVIIKSVRIKQEIQSLD